MSFITITTIYILTAIYFQSLSANFSIQFWDNRGQSLSQRDRRTNSLTPYTGVCGFFLSVKFATSLLASLAGGLEVFLNWKYVALKKYSFVSFVRLCRVRHNKQWLHCRKWQILIAYMVHKWLSWFKNQLLLISFFLLFLMYKH